MRYVWRSREGLKNERFTGWIRAWKRGVIRERVQLCVSWICNEEEAKEKF
jgi:hypothetical protein